MSPRKLEIVALIPTYDNPLTVRAVVERVRAHLPEVIVVDDGSGPAGRAAVAAIGAAGLAQVHHRPRNGGKGAACRDGFRMAAAQGFTHALQVDADGQHDLDDIPRFVGACRAHPEALIAGRPHFQEDAPAARRYGRRISQLCCRIETLGPAVDDPLCGFRIYPLEGIETLRFGSRMDFDPEIAVRLVWAGHPVVNLPTLVRYPPGGVSHFRMVADNLRISLAHARLITGAMLRAPWLLRRAGRRLEPGDERR